VGDLGESDVNYIRFCAMWVIVIGSVLIILSGVFYYHQWRVVGGSLVILGVINLLVGIVLRWIMRD
jgi:hypothetical protein